MLTDYGIASGITNQKRDLRISKQFETKIENEQLPLDQLIVVKHIYISILYLMDKQPKIASSYMKKNILMQNLPEIYMMI